MNKRFKLYIFSILSIGFLYSALNSAKNDDRSVLGSAHYRGDDCTIHGISILNNCSYKNLTTSGFAHLSGITVYNTLKSNGNCNATDCFLTNIRVNGFLELEKTDIYGDINIKGGIKFDHVVMHGYGIIKGAFSAHALKAHQPLEIFSQKIKLVNSSTSRLLIKKGDHSRGFFADGIFGFFKTKQEVVLNNTVINGDIIFEAGNGIVKIMRNSSVKGKIIGGNLESSL